MTKIYIYCLFDSQDVFHGVYSSIDAVHRDAFKLCLKRGGEPLIHCQEGLVAPSPTRLRNLLRGKIDVQLRYMCRGAVAATIIKTKLKE